MSKTLSEITFMPKSTAYRIGAISDLESIRDIINIGDIVMQRDFCSDIGYDYMYEVILKDDKSITMHHLLSEYAEEVGNHDEDYVYTFLPRTRKPFRGKLIS